MGRLRKDQLRKDQLRKDQLLKDQLLKDQLLKDQSTAAALRKDLQLLAQDQGSSELKCRGQTALPIHLDRELAS